MAHGYDLSNPWQNNLTTPLGATRLNAERSKVKTALDTLDADVAGKIVVLAAPTGVAATDRVAIQTALNAAVPGSVVRLYPGSVYIVDSAGASTTPSHGGTTYRYCIMIPTGVTLDTNGSTLKLAAGVDATLVRGPTAGGTNIGLTGSGTIDGNNNVLTAAVGYAVWFDGITGLTLNINVINTNHGAISLEACSKVRAPRIVIDTCSGFGLGIGLLPAPVTDAWFGYVEVSNVSEWPANTVNFPGNSIVGSAIKCRIDTAIVKNCGAGIKVDQGSVGWTFGYVYGDTCGAGTVPTNSGLKFQGTGTGSPLRCHAEVVHMKAQTGQGLFMDLCVDCSVGTYIGEGNAIAGTTSDVWIAGTRDMINQIRVTGAGSSSITLRSNAVDYRIDRAVLRNPSAAANGITDGGAIGSFGQVLVIDDQGTPKIDRGYRSNSSNSVCRVNHLEIRGATVTPLQRTSGDKVSAELFRTNQTADLTSAVNSADAAYTVTPGSSSVRQFNTATLTANRTVTLANPPGALFGWPSGTRFRFTRTGGGAFNLDIGGLKNLATNQWCEVEVDNTTATWKLVAFGSL